MGPAAHHALFPGTFDPVTLGHVDLIARALRLFGRVTVGVALNPDKRTLFSLEERIDLLRRSTAHLSGVEIAPVPGLVVHAARDVGATVVVRGVRSGVDWDYEIAMARTNAELMPGLDTVLMAPAPELAHVSSTLVRQIAELGGDASPFVPPPVAAALRLRTAATRNP